MQITKQIQNGALAIIFLAALLLPLTGLRQLASAAADTCTWTGGGADTNISTAGNWTGCDNSNVPEDGDILAFDADTYDYSGYDTVVTNDSLTSITGISMLGSDNTQGGRVTIEGSAVGLAGDITDTSSSDVYMSVELDVDVTLAATINASDFRVGENGSLDVSTYNIVATGIVNIQGAVTGSGDISGDNVYLYNADNSSYSGNIVAATGLNINNVGSLGDVTGTTTTPYLCVATTDMSANPTISEDINGLGGNSYSDIAIGYSCGSGGPPPSFDDTTLTFDGTVTLADDAVVAAISKNVVFSDLIESSGVLTLTSASRGTLDKGSGVIKAEKVTTTIAESDKSGAYLSVPNNSIIILNGERGEAYVADGGVLKGTGTVTNNVTVDDGGTIAPGESPGCFNIGGDLIMTGTYEFEIEGEDACDDYDQIIVAGDVSVTGATLDLARLSSYVPELNSEYILVQNDGSNAVTGEFDGWTQGAQVVVDQVTYEIDYAGGDGNDVVLTVVAIDSALAAEAGTPDTGLQSVLANPMIGVATLVISAGTLALLKKKQLI